MSWLLDTCVLCEATKKEPDSKVLHWIDDQNEQELFISVLTLGEIQKGISRLPDGAKRRRLQTWLDEEVKPAFENRVLPVDEAVACKWGQMLAASEKRGFNIPAIDGLIAATALAHNLVVATRDIEDIKVAGVEAFNPWLQT